MFSRVLPVLMLGFLALAPVGRAGGLLQLRFTGEVKRQLIVSAPDDVARVAPHGGQLVEVEVGALVADKSHFVTLHVHLAPGTTGVELAALVARRLRSIGVESVTAPGSGNLWIEDAEYLNLRLGGGLRAEIALAEGPPSSLAIRPPTREVVEQTLNVDVSTVSRPSGGLPVRGTAHLAIPLKADSSAASISAALTRAGQKEWISDRPAGDTWRPVKMKNGAAITGFSLNLGLGQEQGDGDWRAELRL